MQLVLLAVLSLAVCASAVVDASVADYHRTIGIPLATKIKATEEAILANHNPSARIVGGSIARPNSHPYLGGLLITYVNDPGTGVCGSTLISRNRLVTAAHCWVDSNLQASRFVVVLGTHFLFSGGDRIATSTVVTYPGWDPETSQNNAAIIYLQNNVILTNNIQPIALPTNLTESFVGDWAVAIGYGRTSDEQTSVPVLSVVHEVSLQVITNDACRIVFGTRVQANTMCTNGTGGVGTCRGDGGSPLLITRDGQPILIGMSTFVSNTGCERGLPSGYSRVTSFYDFIVRHLS